MFGTDGVRGKAGVPPLDPATVRRLGVALVRALPAGAPRRLLTGRDTRASGVWIERELACGAASQGADVVSAGVIPTPGVAYLARTGGFGAGVMISASHNPFEDNGIKVFSGGGEKFTEDLERQVEAIVADRGLPVPAGEAPAVGSAALVGAYEDHLRKVLPEPGRLGRLRMAIDCANGATSEVAPRLLARLGFEVDCLGCRPDGRNINLDCGSTHPERLAARVAADGFRLGVAFDGDGDRAIFVDHTGRVLDGDAILLLCAAQMQAEGRLRGNAVVATVMSNLGLELGLRALGIDLIRCKVGDKYVMEEMLKRGLSLGGEQSGHIIFSDYLFTGDGLCTTLNVLRTMAVTGRELADLASALVTYPQVLINVPVQARVDLATVPAVKAVMTRVTGQLDGTGRLLVRYSGTEPLLRIMLEGRDRAEIQHWGEEIAAAVREHLG
ncbi:MAG: phosphoglucosamine mutase [Acidobacteriota bacterium]|nr:phosphoglucosamine mutase [Acidobacteriota bacterium]